MLRTPPTFTARIPLLPFFLLLRALPVHGPFVHLPLLPPFPLTAAPTALGANSGRSCSRPGSPSACNSAARRRWTYSHCKRLPLSRACRRGLWDYVLLRPLGHGAISIVRLVRRRSDAGLFPVKDLPKANVLASPSPVAHLLEQHRELARFARARTVFVSPLFDAFETRRHLYFVTSVARYGDPVVPLLQLEVNRMPADTARELFAEIVLGLEELHGIGYLYGDMMLENLLLSASGHIRLDELGLVKRLLVSRCGSECSASSDAARLSVSSEVCASDGAESLLSCCSCDYVDSIVRLLARTHIFVGTRRYFSPEHLCGHHRSNGGYGAPADV